MRRTTALFSLLKDSRSTRRGGTVRAIKSRSDPALSTRATTYLFVAVSRRRCRRSRGEDHEGRNERTNERTYERTNERRDGRADARARARAASGNGGPHTGDPRSSLAVHSDRTDFTRQRQWQRRRRRDEFTCVSSSTSRRERGWTSALEGAFPHTFSRPTGGGSNEFAEMSARSGSPLPP